MSLVVLLPFLFRVMSGCGGQETKNDGGSTDAPSVETSPRDVVPEAHRPNAIECDPSRPPGNPIADLEGGCSTDDECDAGINGRCNGHWSGCASCNWNACDYDLCRSDDACAGHACVCREAVPQAGNWQDFCDVGGDCRVDTDCPSGFCSPSFIAGCGPPAYFCHTPDDECIADVDCADASFGKTCGYDAAKKHWSCQHPCVDS